MNKHILFVHIPKTAGTSFRKAAHEYFGAKNIFFDYSPASPETSKLINETIYHKNDPYAFYKSVSTLDKSFLSGHYPMAKYAPLYDVLNIVSFVRDPVEQVVSHYNHYKNNYNYNKDLSDFIKEPGFINLQSRLLNYIPSLFCGFIGLTEEYNASIDLFNDMYDMDLQHMYVNVKQEGSLDTVNIDKSILDEIEKLNEKDINLYNSVKKQFSVRIELYKKNLPFTYGHIQKNNKDRLAGIAFQQNTDESIAIDIYRDDIIVETVYTNKFRPALAMNNMPRKGFIGFDYDRNEKDIGKGNLYAVVKDTGQKIV